MKNDLGFIQDREAVIRMAARMAFPIYSRSMNINLDARGFHDVYYRVLDMFAHGHIKRLIISMPPQHGKSEGSSRLLPSFLLGINPDLKIAIASYTATVAEGFSRDVQRIMKSDEYHDIFPNSLLSGSKWNVEKGKVKETDKFFEIVNHRGSLTAVGRGGPLTSKTVDISILDDVYANAAEGNSPIIRDAAWSWYTSTVRTRLHNKSQELIVFTRWHEEDIVGHIAESETIIDVESWKDLRDIPDQAWVRLNFPALKVGEPTELDPRQDGEALWEEMHSKDQLLEFKKLDAVQFQCLYQGEPGSSEGRLYHEFKTWIDKSEWGSYVRTGAYFDIADEGEDFTFGICYDIYKSDNKYFDEQKKRWFPIVFALVKDMIYTDADVSVTEVQVPDLINRNGVQKAWIESNNGGSGFEKVVRKKVRCQTVAFWQGGNKESRIITNAAQVNELIIMPFGWESRFKPVYEHLKKFLRKFTANEHDDVEDGLTGLYEKELQSGNVRPYGQEHRGITVRN